MPDPIEITDIDDPCSCKSALDLLGRCYPIKVKVSSSSEIIQTEDSEDCINKGEVNYYSYFSTENEGKGYIKIDDEKYFINFVGDLNKEKIVRSDGYHIFCSEQVGPPENRRYRFGPQIPIPAVNEIELASSFVFTSYFPFPHYQFLGAYPKQVLDSTTGITTYFGPGVSQNKPAGASQILSNLITNGDLSLDKEMMEKLLNGEKYDKKIELSGDAPNNQQHKYSFHITFEIEGNSLLAVNPAEGLVSEGPDCKNDFNPANISYELSNEGNKKLDYTISKGAPWLDLSQTNGSLSPGQKTTLTLVINDQAKDLAEGIHKDQLFFTNATDGNGNSIRNVEVDCGEEQCWQVNISGFEIDEMDPYWKITTHVRGAIQFNFKFLADFKIKKKEGKWKYKEGVIKSADLAVENLYEPKDAWECKPISSDYLKNIKTLEGVNIDGVITDDNQVNLFWPNLKIELNMDARIIVPCKPLPICAEWGSRIYKPEQFFLNLREIPIKLVNGAQEKIDSKVDPQGVKWLSYEYKILKI